MQPAIRQPRGAAAKSSWHGSPKALPCQHAQHPAGSADRLVSAPSLVTLSCAHSESFDRTKVLFSWVSTMLPAGVLAESAYCL